MSPFTAQIQLDPFYQQFLRVQLNCHTPVFEFPKGHDLSIYLQFSLSKQPIGYKPAPCTDETFSIAIPYMEHRNPSVYNHISDNKNLLLCNRIKLYFKEVFHGEIAVRKQKGYFKDEIIWQLLEEYEMEEKYYDRIAREYSRYRLTENTRRYMHNKKHKKISKIMSVQ